MKKVFYTLAMFAAVSLSSCGGEEHKEEQDVTTENHEEHGEHAETETETEEVIVNGMHFYGLEHVDLNQEMISADSLHSAVMANGSYDAVVKAEIEEVCQKAGCWVKLKRDNAEPVMVFFKDHFGIPTNTAPGTEAILHGIGKMDTLSVEFQKHLLDDAKENGQEVSEEEYAAITEDKYEVSFEVDGILVP